MSVAARADVEHALWALRAYDTTALATVSDSGPHVAGVFFAPEIEDGRIQLLLAVLDRSRKAADMAADPRVAFMCSPGNPSRWIQGWGTATRPDLDDAMRDRARGQGHDVDRFGEIGGLNHCKTCDRQSGR